MRTIDKFDQLKIARLAIRLEHEKIFMRKLIILLLFISSPLFAQQNQLVRIYSSDSSIVATGVINNNQRQGLWEFSNPKTNTILLKGNYENGKRVGTWFTYFPDGKKQVEAEYNDGILFGPAKVFDADGELKRSMVFQDSVLVGKYVEYYGKTGQPNYINPKQTYSEGQFEKGKKTGQWVTYHPFGEVAIREFYVNNKKDGPYLEYDMDGKLEVEGIYKEGQLEGEFTRYSDYSILETGSYKNGKKIGPWIRYFPYTKIMEANEFYDENGNRVGTWKYYYDTKRLARIETYENGIAVGTWEEYYPNKAIAKRKTFELGVPVGKYEEFFDDGSPSVQGQYENGMKTGLWKSFFPDGILFSIGEYRNDLKTGLWKYFNKIGILIAEGEYDLGMENGQWVYYYDGGQLKSMGAYKLGFEDGIWGLFYDNKTLTQEEFWDNGRLINISEYHTYDGAGTLDKGTLKDGIGTRITYYTNGKKESEGQYISGKAEGLWTFFHENGRKASEGQMKDGKKEGPWRYYNSAGRLEDLINYKDDEIVEQEENSVSRALDFQPFI